MMTIGLGFTVLAEAGLSSLGMGISPPECAWGSMINDGYRFLLKNPLNSIAPGFAIMLVVFGFNMLGGGIAGSHAALSAAKRGAKFVVFDKGPGF